METALKLRDAINDRTMAILSQQKIDRYAAMMESGEWQPGPPLEVFAMHLGDGHHRLFAWLRTGGQTPLRVRFSEPRPRRKQRRQDKKALRRARDMQPVATGGRSS